MDGMHSAMESIELRAMFNYALRLLLVDDPGSTNSSRMVSIAFLLTAFLSFWGFGLALWGKFSQPNVVRRSSSTGEETTSAFVSGGMATCRNPHTVEIVCDGRIFMKWDCRKGEFVQKEHTKVEKPKGSVSVPENLAKASLQSSRRDLVKLFSLPEKDFAYHNDVSTEMGLLGTDIKEDTIRLWDVQADKFIVVSGGFIQNNLQSGLVSGIVSGEDRCLLRVWDLRSSVKPLCFLLAGQLAFHDAEFVDVFNERAFDLRMGQMGGVRPVDVKELPMRSWRIKDETALPIVSTWNSQDSVFYGRTISSRKIVI